MRGKQRLVLLLFLTFRVLRNPSREFWIATTLKLLKNFETYFFLRHIFAKPKDPGKNKEPTPFIVFLAMTVTKNTSDRPNVSLVHVWKSMKALDRSVETSGLWIVTSPDTFIKSVNQSTIEFIGVFIRERNTHSRRPFLTEWYKSGTTHICMNPL